MRPMGSKVSERSIPATSEPPPSSSPAQHQRSPYRRPTDAQLRPAFNSFTVDRMASLVSSGRLPGLSWNMWAGVPSSFTILAPAFGAPAIASPYSGPCSAAFFPAHVSYLDLSSSLPSHTNPGSRTRVLPHRSKFSTKSSLPPKPTARQPFLPNHNSVDNVDLRAMDFVAPPSLGFASPVKSAMEEDVLIMDGELVCGSWSKPTGSLSPGGSNGGSNAYKTKFCPPRPESRVCRQRSNRQFSRDEEELSNRTRKRRSESSIAGTGIYLSKLQSLPSTVLDVATTAAVGDDNVASVPSGGKTTTNYGSPVRAEPSSVQSLESPIFQWLTTVEEDEDITQALYGPSKNQRLTIFKEICPDSEE